MIINAYGVLCRLEIAIIIDLDLRSVSVYLQALVQCEHFHNELTRQRERLERELASEQEKISQAREAARSESKKEKEELAQTVSSLTILRNVFLLYILTLHSNCLL